MKFNNTVFGVSLHTNVTRENHGICCLKKYRLISEMEVLYNYEYLNCTISCCAIFVLQQLGAFTVVNKPASKFLLL